MKLVITGNLANHDSSLQLYTLIKLVNNITLRNENFNCS